MPGVCHPVRVVNEDPKVTTCSIYVIDGCTSNVRWFLMSVICSILCTLPIILSRSGSTTLIQYPWTGVVPLCSFWKVSFTVTSTLNFFSILYPKVWYKTNFCHKVTEFSQSCGNLISQLRSPLKTILYPRGPSLSTIGDIYKGIFI